MRRDWVILACVVIVTIVGGSTAAVLGRAKPQTALAATRPLPVVTPRRAIRVPAADAIEPAPFSWDYRWALGHPAVGAPHDHAASAVLVDIDSRRVLFSKEPHQRRAMASTTKLMTAIVTLDNAKPTDILTVPPEATRVEPNVMGLSAGEKVSVEDLLYGLMLDSGNDAAETLAAGTLGRAAFVAEMNRRAASLGLQDTSFGNPTGLDDPAQYSSAHDLAVIATVVERNYPLLATIVSTRSKSIPGGPDHKAFGPQNLDKLLWSYQGAIGFKTGLTDAAGTCLVAGARRSNHTLVAVFLDDPVIFTDATAFLDYGFRRLA